MRLEDVRIGNYVYNLEGKVDRIDFGIIAYMVRRPNNNIKPIAVSLEWVDNLYEDEWEFCGIGTRIIYRSVKWPAISIEFDFERVWVYFNSKLINSCDYIHEVQNLYHALTKEEVNFKF